MKAAGTRTRWAAYGVALFATLVAARWAGGQDETMVRSEQRLGERPASQPAAPAPRDVPPELDLTRLAARSAGDGGRDLFPAVSWAQVAREQEISRRPPPRPLPPPRPQAPPLPFTYMGKIVEDGKATVFLVQGDRNLIVREGETVQGSYRVDAIAEQAMTLTYLPLDKQQTLSFDAPVAGDARAPSRTSPPPARSAEELRRDD